MGNEHEARPGLAVDADKAQEQDNGAEKNTSSTSGQRPSFPTRSSQESTATTLPSYSERPDQPPTYGSAIIHPIQRRSPEERFPRAKPSSAPKPCGFSAASINAVLATSSSENDKMHSKRSTKRVDDWNEDTTYKSKLSRMVGSRGNWNYLGVDVEQYGNPFKRLGKKKSNAYKVLKVDAEFMTRREKLMLEKIASADPQLESVGSNCVRQPGRIFDLVRKGQTYNCFVFEPMGPSLLEFTDRPSNKPFSIHRVHLTTHCLLHALEFLHTDGIAHTDIKLDNIQITLPDEEHSYLDDFCAKERSSPSPSNPGKNGSRIVARREMMPDDFSYPILCDFGSAFPDDQQYDGEVQALPYRAPEIILGAGWNHKIDIWNFGVLICQLISGDFIFGRIDQHHSIEIIIKCLGTPPKSFLKRCRKTEPFFDEHGNWKNGRI